MDILSLLLDDVTAPGPVESLRDLFVCSSYHTEPGPDHIGLAQHGIPCNPLVSFATQTGPTVQDLIHRDLVCRLGRIHSAIRDVEKQAAVAHHDLSLLTVDATDKSLSTDYSNAMQSSIITELTDKIDDIASRITVALEKEAIVVEAALERWSAVKGDIAEVLSTPDAADLAQTPESVKLLMRLREVVEEVCALPRCPVEPRVLCFAPAPITDPALGSIVWSRAQRSTDVTVGPLPKYACPGLPLTFWLDLPPAPMERFIPAIAGASVSLSLRLPEATDETHITGLVSILAVLSRSRPEHALPLQACIPLDVRISALRSLGVRLRVAIEVPDDADRLPGACVSILGIFFAGESLLSRHDSRHPQRYDIKVWRGLQCPLYLRELMAGGKGRHVTPTVAPGGRFFVPLASGVLAFAPDGSPEGPLWSPSPEHPQPSRCGAYFDAPLGATPLLLLANASGAGPSVCAIIPGGCAPQQPKVAWVVDLPETSRSCYGVVVFPRTSIAVAAGRTSLAALRLTDGRVIATTRIPRGHPEFMAADETTGDVFLSVSGEVFVYRYGDGSIVDRGRVHAAGRSTVPRPLAVVPAALSGSEGKVLIVGLRFTPEVRIIALADLTLVGEGTLPRGPKVVGMAADPESGALLVCDGGWERGVQAIARPERGWSSLKATPAEFPKRGGPLLT